MSFILYVYRRHSSARYMSDAGCCRGSYAPQNVCGVVVKAKSVSHFELDERMRMTLSQKIDY
jgi:hypothetical protein